MSVGMIFILSFTKTKQLISIILISVESDNDTRTDIPNSLCSEGRPLFQNLKWALSTVLHESFIFLITFMLG
jgi:hypothetical protein